MTSISSDNSISNSNATLQAQYNHAKDTNSEVKAFSRTETAVSKDSVEISQEARNLLENSSSSESWKPWSMMEYETPLVPGSKEEKEFRELMKNVKSQKSDIMSQVKDVFERHGISQKDYGKVKIEVDSSGKISVGGVKDAKAAKAIEKALNSDKTLGKKLLQFQHDEKELSKQIKEYSGCTLFELTMTQQGDINKRIRDRVEETTKDCPPLDEFYWNLGFLGENLNHVVGVQDISDLGFQGAIDFSGETNTLAEPERNIKDELDAMYQKVQEDFEQHNSEVMARMEATGIEMTEEMKSMYLLDAANVKITVDNLGAVTIDGVFSSNADNHKKGEDIVKKRVTEMLNKTEDNSYHINIFTSSSEALIQKMADELGEEDTPLSTKVLTEINGGVVGDIRVSSPQTEVKLQDSIQESVNQMVRGAGVTLTEPLKIEIDDSGKIRATNLNDGVQDSERIQALLSRINDDVANMDMSKRTDRKITA